MLTDARGRSRLPLCTLTHIKIKKARIDDPGHTHSGSK